VNGVKREVRVKALDILEGGRELLLQKGIWCKGDLVKLKAADIKAEKSELEVLLEGTPHRVCALGALYAQPGALIRRDGSIETTRALGYAEVALGEAVPVAEDEWGSTYQPEVPDINDAARTKRQHIIDLYDTAITNVKATLA
jgi:hypothetical protein